MRKSKRESEARLLRENRRNQAMEMKIHGYDVSTIARYLKVSEGTVRKDLDVKLNEVNSEGKNNAIRHRQLQLVRYERQFRAWYDLATKPQDFYDDEGKQYKGPPDATAAQMILRISERIEKLLGLQVNPPQEIVHPEPVELDINIVKTGAMDQLSDEEKAAAEEAMRKFGEKYGNVDD